MPVTLVMYAVEVDDISFGPGLTPAVEAAVEGIAAAILDLVKEARDVPV